MMQSQVLRRIPENDPLAIPAQRQIIDEVLHDNRDLPGATMVVLNELQSRIGFLSDAMLFYVARELGVPPSTVHGVVSFYSFFTRQPRGRHTVKLCMGTACYVGGASQLIEKVKDELHIEPGQTTADGAITVEVCRCVGACSQAPVMTLDEVINGRMRPNKVAPLLRKCR